MSAASPGVERVFRCAACGECYAAGVLRCPRDGALLDDAVDPFAGALLAGRYRLSGPLGRGGMSTVYLARHVVIDRLAAVKILRRDLAADPAHRGRFLQEARAVNRIQHENIVDVTDYGETVDGVVYLVMEYLPGESLLAAMRGGPLPLPRALDIARQIASGLGRAHEMRVIHRDLKPDNVILVPRERGRQLVKLLDFGIAKVLDAPAITLNNRVFGTPGYIAPEYATGAGLSPQADLYALGVVLYEMVTGTLPFDARHPGEMLLRTATEPPIPPSARRASVPRAVESIILRCLEKRPEARHRDAFHLIDEIDRAIAGLRGAAAAPSLHAGDDAPTEVRAALTEDTARQPSLPAASAAPQPTPHDGEPPRGGALDLQCPAPGATAALADAWDAFLVALRGRIGAHFWSGAPEDVGDALDALAASVAAMREETERAELLGVRLIGVEARGKDFRLTIGHAMDALSADLSARARERDAVAARRDAMAARRAESPLDDAALWALAAAEQLLAELVRACDDIEFQRASLRRQLDQLNESLEREQAELTAALTRALDAIRAGDLALRERVTALDARLSRTTASPPAGAHPR